MHFKNCIMNNLNMKCTQEHNNEKSSRVLQFSSVLILCVSITYLTLYNSSTVLIYHSLYAAQLKYL